jgi:4-hydroxymandelate oxidase
VDTPVVAVRYPLLDGPEIWEMAQRGWIGANTTGTGAHPEARAKAMDLGPGDIAWLGEVTGRPVVVKGVLRADDARVCVEAGASAVWVSNHGGRQLDQAVATARCVGSVRAAVGDRAEVYVDGGIRTGLHAMLALALGADAVFVGRPLFHALAAGGQEGVRRGLEELHAELVEAMRLAGCSTAVETRGIVLSEGS